MRDLACGYRASPWSETAELAVFIALPSLWRSHLISAHAANVLFASVAVLLGIGGLIWFVAQRSARALRLRQLVREGAGLLIVPTNVAPHLAISFVLLILNVAGFWYVARALDFNLGLLAALRIVPFVMVAASLPAFFAGWGVREAAAASLYYLCGLNASEGALVSVGRGELPAGWHDSRAQDRARTLCEPLAGVWTSFLIIQPRKIWARSRLWPVKVTAFGWSITNAVVPPPPSYLGRARRDRKR